MVLRSIAAHGTLRFHDKVSLSIAFTLNNFYQTWFRNIIIIYIATPLLKYISSTDSKLI